MDKPSCQAALKAAHDRINDEHCGIMGPHPPPMRKPPGEIYPLSASCAKCKTDASAGADMKRCSACKMTRCVVIRSTLIRLSWGVDERSLGIAGELPI